MDEKDRKILDILKEDARASYTDIAEEIEVSEGTVRNHVEKMVEEEVIQKFTVETEKTGPRALVMVDLSTGKDIDQILEDFPADIEVNEVAGDHDLILEFNRETTEELNRQLDKIRKVEGVKDTKTYTVLKTRKR